MDVNELITKFPSIGVAELIRIFFKDKHTYYDPDKTPWTISRLKGKEPWVEIDETKRTLTIRLGTFIGLFAGTKYETQYVDKVQNAIRQEPGGRKLVIDLRYNGGGSDKVMFKALRGIEKWGRGIVLVSRKTASAAEMVAACLIHDRKFERRGGRTAGALSHCKNVILSDGSFLGITTGKYTTPGGHLCKKFYL